MNFVTLVKTATATRDIYELSKALEYPKYLPELCSCETHHNLRGQNHYINVCGETEAGLVGVLRGSAVSLRVPKGYFITVSAYPLPP